MSLLIQITHAVRFEIRKIMVKGLPDKTARRMIRVEINEDQWSQIEEEISLYYLPPLDRVRYSFEAEGVTWYRVADLPEPGWRIINPMD